MCWTRLWLLAFLAFSSLPCQTVGSPLKVMSAPNLLRVGTVENIFVECQDCSGGDMVVTITVKNHPTKNKVLALTSVTLTSAQGFQGLGQIKIPAEEFSRDPTMKQYVYLQAHFPDQVLEKVVLVSFQSGYIFIQTDKTLYTPDSKVYYRMFAVTPGMEPVERDEITDAVIDIEFLNPKGITLSLETLSLWSGIYSGSYHLGEFVTIGVWKVVAKFHSSPQQTFSAEFEVKEYVLPSFEVKLIPLSSFFYVDSPTLTIDIKAKYLFGEEVEGAAYVVFGVVHVGQKKSFPDSVQKVEISGGVGEVILKREHIIQSFNMDDLVGSSIFVSVSVLTENGGEMVEAELRGIQIVTSPYTINFKKTPKYFKPGMSFDVAVQVMNPDETPAEGVPVVVGPGDVYGITEANGIAKVTVNTVAGDASLTVTAKTNDPQIPSEKQVSATMNALPYQTSGNNYIHIGVDTAELELGSNLRVSLFLNTRPHNDITYLILSRGQLVKYGRYTTRGHVLISLPVPITKEMLPSFRIIAYYHTNSDEVVSDSVWVDVKDTCMGSLKLESSRLVNYYRPRGMFGLTVTGDPGATVGLVAVDKGVYVLNNKFRLTQKKVWDLVEKYDTGCTPGGGKNSMGVFYDAGLLFESSSGSGTPYRQELRCPLFTRSKRASAAPDRDEEDDSYMDSSEIVSRTRFPESWLWFDIRLPACPPQTPNCMSTSSVKNVPLPDSITTWQFLGISLSRTHGICVSSPLEVLVKKEFFIDLKLPQSAVRGEQLEIKAVINNYTPETITVRVELFADQHVCSAAYRRGMYRQEVKIGSNKNRIVPFIIIPLKEGQHHIEVKAAVYESALTDGIKKFLKVVPESKLTKHLIVKTLAPAELGIAGVQREIINSRISPGHLLPGTFVQTIISITGREPLSARVEDAITLQPMERMIYQPTGNGEVNMIHMTMTVIATTYLDKTFQWESVGLQKRSEALQYIKTGYQNELAYRKSDGSFSALPNLQSSSWLTAYVAKVFAKAFNLMNIPLNMICDAVKFVILNAQQPDGSFREVGTIVHGEMAGDVRGADSDASMTASCLIALQETRPLCSDTVNSLAASIDKGVTYLERRLPSLTNPYAVAITSYALANEDKLNQRILYKFASQDSSHWPSSVKHVFTLEATAYALLALVKVKAFEDARPIVRWFTSQRVGGGYESTQANLIVYQALAEYWTRAREQRNELHVKIVLPGRSRPDLYYFNKFTLDMTRTVKFPRINEDIEVTATGTGEATLTVMSVYYALPSEQQSDCQKFKLTVQLLPENVSVDEKVYKMKIEVLFKHFLHDAGMSVLDIGLLTGFTVNPEDLNLLSRDREMKTVLTESSSLLILLDKVSHTQPKEITFRISQNHRVDVLQPAAVSVYEYHDQKLCVKFYHPERTDGQLHMLCRNNDCICVEGGCARQQKGKIENDVRLQKACESTPTSQTNYIYKVRVEEYENATSIDVYKMSQLEVIMDRSTFPNNPLQSSHIFISHPSCRELLGLSVGKTYLIMGTSRDIYIGNNGLYEYNLGETTWIEYWPTEAECQTEEHSATCIGIKSVVWKQTQFGCEQ